jgi:ribosomal protein S18 acetylase RimI-like enzyme
VPATTDGEGDEAAPSCDRKPPACPRKPRKGSAIRNRFGIRESARCRVAAERCSCEKVLVPHAGRPATPVTSLCPSKPLGNSGETLWDRGWRSVLDMIWSVPGPKIRRIGASELDLIEPLWNALREHHSQVTPTLGEPRPREESWQRRRSQYADWLAGEQAFVLLAEREEAVGYAMVHIREGSPTWPLSERAGEIETLSVLPGERGLGTGSSLLHAVRGELAALGITELSLHVMHTNKEAMRFYERHGFETYALWVRSAKPPEE